MYDPADPVPYWTVSTMRQVAGEPTIAAAAIRYASLGIPVFPCAPGGKQPLTPNGFHDATSSARVVHHWWQRNPDASIGLPTGSSTGILVVDIDVHSGGSGFEAFERAQAEGLADNWGWMRSSLTSVRMEGRIYPRENAWCCCAACMSQPQQGRAVRWGYRRAFSRAGGRAVVMPSLYWSRCHHLGSSAGPSDGKAGFWLSDQISNAFRLGDPRSPSLKFVAGAVCWLRTSHS